MGWIRTRTAVATIGLIGALIAGAAYELVHTHEQARSTLRSQLAHRAQLTADFASKGVLSDPQLGAAQSLFSGPERGLPAALRQYQGQSPLPRAFVLDGSGRVLAADPPSLARDAQLVESSPHLRAALRGRTAFSGVFTAQGGQRVFETAVPFEAKHGRRVFVTAVPVDVLQAAIGEYLPNATAVGGGHAYFVDAHDQVLAAWRDEGIGATLADERLRSALAHDSYGTYGDRTFVSAPVDGTSWRVAFSVPTAALYASVEGATRRTTWALFGAFVLALLALLAVGATALRRSARLAHERLHDPLTGLPNRALFLDRVDRALAGAQRSGEHVALLFIDLDRFKRVNDSLGHAAGDLLLREVARRTVAMSRWMDSVSRFGGDEFLVLCQGLHDAEEAQAIAARFQEGLALPIDLGSRELSIGCSIGIAVRGPGDDAVTAEEFLQLGDAAMYRAKRRGRARVEMLDSPGDDDDAAALELDIEAALRASLAAGGLRVHYRPVGADATTGVEAVARWHRPGHGLVRPEACIDPVANARTAELIAEWVLRAAMTEVGEWAHEGLVDDRFELTLSVASRQLSDPAFLDAVAAGLRGWPLPATSLELHVKGDPEPSAIERLRDLGVRIARDGDDVPDAGVPIDGAHLRRELLAPSPSKVA